MWLLSPKFKGKFSLWWKEFQGEGHRFMKRLHYVKSKLKQWNKVSFGSIKERKKDILEDIVIIVVCEQEGN